MQPLSNRALNVLQQLFSDNSTMQLPVAVAEQAIEIRRWVNQEIQRTTPVS